MNIYETTSPTGDTISMQSPLGGILVVIWAWSNSCSDWLRQSGPVDPAEAVHHLASITADCPTVRAVLTPCRFG